jgi:hypothetical protein
LNNILLEITQGLDRCQINKRRTNPNTFRPHPSADRLAGLRESGGTLS